MTAPARTRRFGGKRQLVFSQDADKPSECEAVARAALESMGEQCTRICGQTLRDVQGLDVLGCDIAPPSAQPLQVVETDDPDLRAVGCHGEEGLTMPMLMKKSSWRVLVLLATAGCGATETQEKQYTGGVAGAVRPELHQPRVLLWEQPQGRHLQLLQ